MHMTGKKRAIRNALFRLGLHARVEEVVHALARQGVQVTEEVVRQVRFELLKKETKATVAKVHRPAPHERCGGGRRDFR